MHGSRLLRWSSLYTTVVSLPFLLLSMRTADLARSVATNYNQSTWFGPKMCFLEVLWISPHWEVIPPETYFGAVIGISGLNTFLIFKRQSDISQRITSQNSCLLCALPWGKKQIWRLGPSRIESAENPKVRNQAKSNGSMQEKLYNF
jgi:hypothetical protein